MDSGLDFVFGVEQTKRSLRAIEVIHLISKICDWFILAARPFCPFLSSNFCILADQTPQLPNNVSSDCCVDSHENKNNASGKC